MIDPTFLEEVDRFDASLEQEATGIQRGEQESPDVGEGLTFSDYRRYSPGDDTRLIDWRLYGRTGEYYIKQFEEERSLTVHILVDASASMDYGRKETDTHKFEFGAKLGLGYAHLTAEAHDKFKFSIFQDRPERLDAGTSTRGEVLGLIDRINETTPSGQNDFAAALESYVGLINSRSLVVIITDCLGDLDALESGLASVAQNDVILIQLLAPGEVDPDPAGDTIFEGIESDVSQRTYFGGRLLEQYRNRIDGFIDDVEARAQRLRITHAFVPTDQDFFDAFATTWVG